MKKVVSIVGIMIIYCTIASTIAKAQIDHTPVKWEFTSIPISAKKAKLVFTANLDEGWHIYSQFIEAGGPLPTTFTFIPDSKYSLKGKVKEEGKPVEAYDSTFEIKIVCYKNAVTFSQEVSLQAPAATIKGTIEFMICTHETCLPPKEVSFSVDVKPATDATKGK
jgi:thiol:disulfide interchange protein DsbD